MTKIKFYLGMFLLVLVQSSMYAQGISQECYKYDADAEPQFVCDDICPACDAPSFIFTFNISTFYIGENEYFLTVNDGTIPPFRINPISTIGGAEFDQEPNEDPFGFPVNTISFILYEGCYSFRITDIFGDGVFDLFADSFYSLEIDGVEVDFGVNFGLENVFEFCLTEETCDDGVQNGDEEGVDCGGASCAPCVTCEDGMQNGDEEGVDCGGTFCEPCITCEDGVQNGDEDGVDCGGSLCEPCFTCEDGEQNGDEEGVDCGGSFCAPCHPCLNDTTNIVESIQICESINLIAGQNYTAGMVEVQRDGDELIITYTTSGEWTISESHLSIVNCETEFIPTTGSGNPKIGQFELSGTHDDVQQVVYIVNLVDAQIDDVYCMAAHAVVNGYGRSETAWGEGTDFAGNNWAMYVENNLSDCTQGYSEVCVTCIDGVQNWDEEGIDCGGAFCEPCAEPTCDDGILNGDEINIDCGGTNCEPCDCLMSLVYDNIVCNDNGTTTPNDDVFTVDITISGTGTSDKWNGTLGGQQMYGEFDVPVTFGPFLTNSGSNINGWFMDANIMNCAVDIIIQAPRDCLDDTCIDSNGVTCSSCDDGVKNGNEEGIDCGGAFCEPCHPCQNGTTEIDDTMQVCESINLIAGQNYTAGMVEVRRDGDELIITYITSGEWTISETHLSIVNCETEFIPTTGSGNPKIGQFELSGTHDDVQKVVYIVNLEDAQIDDVYCMAAHAVVDGDGRSETAWGEGMNFDGNSWAMFVENNLSDCVQSGSDTCVTCTDRVQNWDEEGVDCGGAYCQPCRVDDSNSPDLVNNRFASISHTQELLTVYPNPARNVVNISFEELLNEKSIITITNLNGRQLKRFEMDENSYSNQISLDVSLFDEGFYFVNLKSETRLESKKFVVLR